MASSIDYDQMREMTRNFLSKGVSAVETNAIFQGKFGPENSPTLCTIYKWRRELRGGMGEREANDQNGEEKEGTEDGQQQTKGAKLYKKDCDKYCVPCNREMSSRHYYELHMLKIHNVFVGDSKALFEALASFGAQREKQIIFRCDECFGGELDYELLEDLRRHRLLEHGRKMREPTESAWTKHFEMPSFVPAFSLSPRRSMGKSRRCRSTIPFAHSPTNKKDEDCLDECEENTKTLRYFTMVVCHLRPGHLRLKCEGESRSARVPKPSPALLQSLLNAKEFANFEGIVQEEIDGNESEDNEAERIVTIMKDGRIEVEEPDQKGQKQQAKKNDDTRKRTMSPDAMDAADSMLKLAFTEKQQNNAKLAKQRDGSPKVHPTEALLAEKRVKSFSIARPNRHDDCTWFGHSVAASLRQMPIQTKELAKSRIQQVIYECAATNTQNNNGKNAKKGAQQNESNKKSDGMDEGEESTISNTSIFLDYAI